MDNNIIVIIIGIIILIYFVKSKYEGMENIPKQRLEKQYSKNGDNIIYGRNFEKMYKAGHFYFLEGEYDNMLKFYRPIIDEFNKLNMCNEEPLFIERDKLDKLYNLVQLDISLSVDKQETCEDYGSCLDVNRILPVAL
jgi:hypothetical protein